MNHLKSLFGVLFFVLASLAVKGQTENQPVYYRYFTVEIPELNQAEFNQFANARTANSYFKYDKYCSNTFNLLVRFDASQPKRIEVMKSEITGELQTAFPTKTVTAISTLSYSDHLNFCK